MNHERKDSMTHSNALRITVFGLVAFSALALSGCSETSTASELGALQIRLTDCPADHRELAAFISDDASGTGRSDNLSHTRLDVIRDVLTQVAVCGGRAKIVAFSSSAAATATIYESELKPAGATENARLRRVPALIDAAMETVNANYASAVESVPPGGTDVFSQLTLGREYIYQLASFGTDPSLWLVIQSDGIQTVGSHLADPSLTPEQGTAIGSNVAVPQLPGVDVLITGIGKTAGDPPSTTYIDALKAAYQAACENTSAASCTIVTDYAGR